MTSPGVVVVGLLVITSCLCDVIVASSAGSSHENELYMASCRKDLGMYSKQIPDSAITASSSYDERNVGAVNSRIRTERSGGAWCPRQQIAKDVYEWLQIDLGELKIISLVETQGRFGNGQGQEFTTNYRLEYQRLNDTVWRRYKNHNGSEILKGNINTYIAEVRELRPPIIARRVRFVPFSSHPRTVCMRVELYGCTSKDSIVSYSMKQGDRRGSDLEFFDFTYDGNTVDGRLLGGLGQLVDGEQGLANFRLDGRNIGHRGYEWIAWKTDRSPPSSADPIEIIFELDSVRTVTGLRVHANNAFSKDVGVFSSAEVHFSVGGRLYDRLQEPVYFRNVRDSLVELPRFVVIPIAAPGRHAKYVRLVLYFDLRWIMISEVHIDSEPTNSTHHDEFDDSPLSVSKTTVAMTTPAATTSSAKNTLSSTPSSTSETEARLLSAQDAAIIEIDLFGSKEAGDKYSDVNGVDPGRESDPLPSVIEQTSTDLVLALVLSTTAAFVVVVCVLGVLVLVHCRRRGKRNDDGSPIRVLNSVNRRSNFNLNYLSPSTAVSAPAKVSNGMLYNAVATGEYEPISVAAAAGANRQQFSSVCKLNNVFNDAIDDVKLSLTQSEKLIDHDISWQQSNCNVKPTVSSAAVTSPESLTPVNVDGSTDDQGSLTSDDTNLLPTKHTDGWFTAVELPRDVFKFVNKLGDGVFGEVTVCEMYRVHEFISDSLLSDWCQMSNSGTMLVAIRTLRKFASCHERNEFDRAVKQLGRLNDPNVVQILGVIRQGEPLSIVMEYLPYGDLRQFLMHRVFDETSTGKSRNGPPSLSYGCLLYIATQIASGMKYLAECGVVHRDLAARNCLVGSQLKVKVADFGLVGGGRYAADYCHVDDSVGGLPVRWMAWESVVMRKFTSRSDVWSFGVTLWELLSFARRRPFDTYTDDQLVLDYVSYYRGRGQLPCLEQPRVCTKEIYDLMAECWNGDDSQRPTFREIHMFLTHKSTGYRPTDGTDNLAVAVDIA